MYLACAADGQLTTIGVENAKHVLQRIVQAEILPADSLERGFAQ